MGLMLYLIVHIFTNPETLATNKEILSLVTALLNPMTSGLYSILFILIYVGYAGLNELMSKMLHPLYITKIPVDITIEAEKYYLVCNPQVKEAFDEEERILKRAREIAAKRQREEAEFLAKVNYVNPIYKRIKMGILVALVIISFIFAGNKLKGLDIEKLLNSLGSGATEESTEGTEVGTEINTELEENHE